MDETDEYQRFGLSIGWVAEEFAAGNISLEEFLATLRPLLDKLDTVIDGGNEC